MNNNVAVGKWKTKSGETLDISNMEDSHIVNAIHMISKRGFVSPKTVSLYVCGPEPNGDMAQLAFDQEFDSVLESPISWKLGELEDEADKRGLRY